MDLGSKGKILLGSRGNYFQGSGEINALFSEIKGAQTPLGASYIVKAIQSLIVQHNRLNMSIAMRSARSKH